MPDEPVVPWEPERPVDRSVRDVNRLGPVGFVVVALAIAIAVVRFAGEILLADSSYLVGRALGTILGPVVIGAAVWWVVLPILRRRTPERRFVSGGLAITIAVLVILGALGSISTPQ